MVRNGSDNNCPKCGKPLVPNASYCPSCGTRIFQNAQGEGTADPYLGQLIENTFEVQSVLGTGSMGIVYKAYNRAFNNFVAIKVLRHDFLTDRVVLTRFQREAQAASSLEHPNVIRIFHFGRTHLNAPYIAMECLNGTELAQLIPNEFPLNQQRVCSFALQVARALEAAHKANIIHRDLKPANIVVVNETGREVIKVLDFGIAKIADVEGEGLTKEGAICGTPAFMSPEQVVGKQVTATSDIFSLGSVMYFMLTCKLPFSGSSMADMAASIMLHDPTPPAQARIDAFVHPRLAEICMKALQKAPENRYQSATEMIADLEAAMAIVNQPVGPQAKPKIVVGTPDVAEDLSGETCCGISVYEEEEEEEEGGTVVEMQAMPEDFDLLTPRGPAPTAHTGNAIGGVLSLKNKKIGSEDRTIVHGKSISILEGENEKDAELAQKKKLLLLMVCLVMGCSIIGIIILVLVNSMSSSPEKSAPQAVVQTDDESAQKDQDIDAATLRMMAEMTLTSLDQSATSGAYLGIAIDDKAERERHGIYLDDKGKAEDSDSSDRDDDDDEDRDKSDSARKKSSSDDRKSSSKSSKRSSRKSASSSSSSATEKLKAAEKAEKSGDKTKACAIYKSLYNSKEPLTQADRIKIMGKVRGCNRITI